MATQQMIAAIRASNLDKVKELFQVYSTTSTVNSRQDNELIYYAAKYDQEKIVKYFLKIGCNPNGRSGKNGLLPLQATDCPIMIDLLIKNGADINSVSYDGNTPLHSAVYSSAEKINTFSAETVRHLLERGANPYAINKVQDTPLAHLIKYRLKNDYLAHYKHSEAIPDHSLEQNTKEVIKLLLDCAPDLPLSKTSILTLAEYLHVREKYGELHPEYFDEIQCALAEIKRSFPDSEIIAKIIYQAIEKGKLTFIRAILPTQLEHKQKNTHHYGDLLYLAVRYNQAQIAQYFLEQGHNPNTLGSSGLLPLQIVASPSMIDLLIRYGANINATSRDGQTPLHKAVRSSSLEIVQALLKHKADPYATNTRCNMSPFHLLMHSVLESNDVISDGTKNIIKFFLKDNIDPYFSDKNGLSLEMFLKVVKQHADSNTPSYRKDLETVREIREYIQELNLQKSHMLKPSC